MKVSILMSGGIDSTACAHYFLQRRDDVTAVFIDYDQLALRSEWNAVQKVTQHFNIPLLTMRFTAGRQFTAGEIPGRNAFLIFAVLMGAQLHSGVLSLGIHAGTAYYDCGATFAEQIGQIIDAYSGGKLALHCPFLAQDKAFVYRYAKDEKIPIHLTYSCERGTVPPCGLCLSCRDRNALQTC